jgi:hypothetical protein
VSSVWVSFRPSIRKQQHGVGGGGKEVAHAFQVFLMITAPSTDAIHQDPAHFLNEQSVHLLLL